MAHWANARERSVGKKQSERERPRSGPSPGSAGDALNTSYHHSKARVKTNRTETSMKAPLGTAVNIRDRIDLSCISTCEKWVNCRFGRGRWTRPSRYPSSVVRIYPTYTNMHPLTGQCRRCLRGWRKKRNRYDLILCKCENIRFGLFIIFTRSHSSLFFFCASFHKMAADFLRRKTTDLCRTRTKCGTRTAVRLQRGCVGALLGKIARFGRLIYEWGGFQSTKESCDFSSADILCRLSERGLVLA